MGAAWGLPVVAFGLLQGWADALFKCACPH
jgi:hypothetical protein